MARIETDPNYTTPTFSRATAATDIFKKEDVQQLAASMSTHDHTSGKGLGIGAAGIADGSITSAKIADGTIDTVDLAANAITQSAMVQLGADFATSSTSFVDVTGASITLTTTGGAVLLFHMATAQAVTNIGVLGFNQDGIDTAPLTSFSNSAGFPLPSAMIYRYAPAAGSHTYKVRARVSAGGTLNIFYSAAANGVFMAVELKR